MLTKEQKDRIKEIAEQEKVLLDEYKSLVYEDMTRTMTFGTAEEVKELYNDLNEFGMRDLTVVDKAFLMTALKEKFDIDSPF